jgi:hypothetical protein
MNSIGLKICKAVPGLYLFGIYVILALCPSASAQDGLPTLVKKAQPSVVVVTTFDNKGSPEKQGTGFFVNAAGDIVTNRHVMVGAAGAKIKTVSGKVYEVKGVVGEDKDSDLIQLKTNVPKGAAKPLRFSPSSPQAGQRVIVIGNPLGLEQTVSDGIISAIRETSRFGRIIQITAPISQGSSGSPVLDLKGDVIGVATLQIIDGQNLNFAIPVTKIPTIKPNKEQRLSVSLQPIIEEASLSGPLFSIQWNGKRGFIDKTGVVAIKPQFDHIHMFTEGLAAVAVGGRPYGEYLSEHGIKGGGGLPELLLEDKVESKWGYIDRTGFYAINPKFDDAGSFSEGLAAVQSGSNWGYIDKLGAWAIRPMFEDANGFSEGIAGVKSRKQWGYIDRTGRYVIQPQFDRAFNFHEGMAVVRMGKKFGVIDKTGKIVIDIKFRSPVFFNEGLAHARENDKYGYIDRMGRYVIQPQFDFGYGFSEGLAAVQVGKKWGFIDREGSYRINPQFDDANRFVNGLASVEINPGSIINTGDLTMNKFRT